MDNNFRHIYGRRGPNSRTSSGINLMRGYFIVQFYDDNKPELYVINDENTKILNNEIKSTSPLAKAVMDNKVGSAFFIEDYLEKELGTKTGVSIIKKELEYIDYNPVLDGKAQYNYYYIKSYLDYVEPRKIEMKKEFDSNGKKVYIDLEFVSYDKLNKLINSLVRELKNRIKYDYTDISDKHKEDAYLKITKLEDMKDKNFYQEDLDYIKLDIEKYIFYEMSYYDIFDLYIKNLIDDIESDESVNNSSNIIKTLKTMLESNTIDENNEIYNKVYPRLEKIGKNYLPRFEIVYADFDYKPFSGYSILKKNDLDDIINHYYEKFNSLCEEDISFDHRKVIKKQLNPRNRNSFSSNGEFDKHLHHVFYSEAKIYLTFDNFAKKLLEKINYVDKTKYIPVLRKKASELLSTESIEETIKLERSIYRLSKKHNAELGYDSLRIGTIKLSSHSYHIEFSSIVQFIIYMDKINELYENPDLVKKAYMAFMDGKDELFYDDTSYSMTADNIIQDKISRRRKSIVVDEKNEYRLSNNNIIQDENIDWKYRENHQSNVSNNSYRKTKDEIIQDDLSHHKYVESKSDNVRKSSAVISVSTKEYIESNIINNNTNKNSKQNNNVENGVKNALDYTIGFIYLLPQIIGIIITIFIMVMCIKACSYFEKPKSERISEIRKQISKAKTECSNKGAGWHLVFHGCSEHDDEGLSNGNCVWQCIKE